MLLVMLLAVGMVPAQTEEEWRVAVLPSGAEFDLELARTDVERGLGYMYREQIGDNEGMLFFMGETDFHGFWMKNCAVNLDLIWLDERFEVAYIAHQQPPCPPGGECPQILPMKAGNYILEIAGGRAEAEGLQVGDRIVMLGEPQKP
jgi:uncharacterized membrane protein (UPF0127 family)